MTDSLSKARRNQLRLFYAHYIGAKNDEADIRDERGSDATTFKAYIASGGSWGKYYTLPFNSLALSFYSTIGFLPLLIEAAKSACPQQYVLDHLERYTKANATDFQEANADEQGVIFSLLMAMVGNMNSLVQRHVWLSHLVAQAASGDDDSLFAAITVDRAALQAEPIAQRICLAQFLGDESFMNRLAKAVTRTKPTRPKPHLDDTRLILELLADTKSMETLQHKDIYDILVEDLQVYSDDGKDPMSGLKKLLQERNAKSRR